MCCRWLPTWRCRCCAGDAAGGQPDALCARQYARRGENGFYPYRPCQGVAGAHGDPQHALRNALLPIITLLGFELPGLFSGAIITEKVFNWPGAGHIHIDSLAARDYPVLMGFTLFLAVLTIVGNLLADVLYAWADPRIRVRS
ncbi:Oligopeptide transport system permease OppB [Klebsiella pneumoniae]|nr:Oligopeptide transport system permease OppB [Klebsiella pneumoniae]